MSGSSSTPPPKGWLVATIAETSRARLAAGKGGPQQIYLNPKLGMAQYAYPEDQPIRHDVHKTKAFASLCANAKKLKVEYCLMMPQPRLIHGWIQVVELPKRRPKKGPTPCHFVYCSDRGSRTEKDHTPPDIAGAPFPAGWSEEMDEDGYSFFMNRNTLMRTYDDPRIFRTPMSSRYLEVWDSIFTQHAAVDASQTKNSTEWRIGPASPEAFNALSAKMVPLEEIPFAARNKHVNRYLDIVPCKATAITLPQIKEGGPMSEYINANAIAGIHGQPKQFIAAMGPKKQTLREWWRMIWQEHVQDIVMLTNFMEHDAIKCHQYIPLSDETMKVKGDHGFEISLASPKEVQKDFTVAQYLVKHRREKRRVTHYWYTTWPDHEVPRYPTGGMYTKGMLEFTDKVRANSASGSPIVVHCSAGVGRTGAFIGLHHAQDQLRNTGRTNPVALIDSLRDQRPSMVQHLSQFLFIHECIVEWVKETKISYEVMSSEPLNDSDNEKMVEAHGEYAYFPSMREEERLYASFRRANRVHTATGGLIPVVLPPKMTAAAILNAQPLVDTKGDTHRFDDLNDDGQLDWGEASTNGWSREFFNQVSGGADTINAEQYLEFRAKSLHPEYGNPWFAGDLDMSVAAEWVKSAKRGDFLILRAPADQKRFQCVVSVLDDKGLACLGQYELQFTDGYYVLSGNRYASLKHFVHEATVSPILKDAKGAVKLAKAIDRTAIERRINNPDGDF